MPHDQPSAPGALQQPPEIRKMFDSISGRYDLLNRIMTGGRDLAWRRQTARIALAGESRQRVLDVATGTGDMALALLDAGAGQVIGLDFSAEMLRGAREKIGFRSHCSLLTGDAMRLPFPDATFDACTVAFGLRNMADYAAAVRELVRVIRPGGRFVCLELSPPPNRLMATVFDLHIGHVMPMLGGIISGDRAAYSYLPRSAAAFPAADTLTTYLRDAGLTKVTYRRLALGTVALHSGVVGRRQ